MATALNAWKIFRQGWDDNVLTVTFEHEKGHAEFKATGHVIHNHEADCFWVERNATDGSLFRQARQDHSIEGSVPEYGEPVRTVLTPEEIDYLSKTPSVISVYPSSAEYFTPARLAQVQQNEQEQSQRRDASLSRRAINWSRQLFRAYL